MMLTHAQIWTALDRLAAVTGLSPSGLAKKSGLDPTTFNKSKRITADGRPRWPSTESVAKALAATGTSLDAFVQLVGDGRQSAAHKTMPAISLDQAGKDGFFDGSGFPAGAEWQAMRFPAIDDQHAFALEINGQSLEPSYTEGTVLLVSPAATIRRGDRVVLKTLDGEAVMVRALMRRTARAIELRTIDAEHREHTILARDVAWIARIVWASQ
jgi:phage repressor protein C with HTH and peptisase S24 domain